MSGSILNVVVKLTALLLAFLLWFNVITEKQYEHEVRLPVTSFEFPPNLGAVTALPDSLNVKVASEGKKLLRTTGSRPGCGLKASVSDKASTLSTSTWKPSRWSGRTK